MDKKKVVEFVKTHKKDIAVGAITAVVGTVSVVLLKKSFDANTAVANAIQKSEKFVAETAERIAKIDWRVGRMVDIWDEGGYTNAIVYDVTVDKLGEFGNEFKKLEGVKDETITSILIGYANNTKI